MHGGPFREDIYPMGPCSYVVHTLALKGYLGPDFGGYVDTIVLLGPFGIARLCVVHPGFAQETRCPRHAT